MCPIRRRRRKHGEWGQLDGERRSISNSAMAARALEDSGLGIETFAEVVREALTATKRMAVKRGREWQFLEMPDHATRAWAAEQLRDIFGWRFQPEQKQEVIPLHLIQYVQYVQSLSWEELQREAAKRGIRYDPSDRLSARDGEIPPA